MYNVMIVDDEPVIRYGLKASVNWELEGLSFIGDFSNGQEALNAMEKSHVDILITDIKMPIMDGLTLMKEALARFPKIKVVLVSSYNDFEYVQEGLRHGAVDYVLKPTLEPTEFLKLIQKCVKLLKNEKSIERKLTLIDETTKLQSRKRVEQNLKHILQGEIDNNLEELPNWMSNDCLIIYMRINKLDKVEEEYGSFYQSFVLEETQENFYLKFEDGVSLIIGDTDMLFLLTAGKDPINIIQELKKQVIDQTMLKFRFGYDVIRNIKEVTKGFQRSLLAIDQYFFNPEEDIFQYTEQNVLRSKKLKAEQLKQFLLPYDKKKLKTFLEERYKVWKAEEMLPSDIQSEARDIITEIYANKLNLSIIIDKTQELKKQDTLLDLYNLLINQIEECDRLIQEASERSYTDNELIERALDYIHQHYTEVITLQMIADHVHISRNYFSILFKRFLNTNFIDYLIDLRIKKATELLTHTSLKIYEVARESGFNDVKYFSKLFKKVTGYSPVDYRSKQQRVRDK